MAKVNPKAPEHQIDERSIPHPGRKVLMPLSYDRVKTEYGDRITVAFAVVEDLSKGRNHNPLDPDEGMATSAKFTISDRGTRYLCRYALAAKHTDEFDPDLDTDLDLVFTNPVIGEVEHDSFTDDDNRLVRFAKVTNWETYKGEVKPEWKPYIDKANEAWDEKIKRAAERAEEKKKGGGNGKSKRANKADVPF